MSEIKRDGELSYITRTAPLLRGSARREAQSKRQYRSVLDRIKAINRAAFSSPEHQRAIKELPPTFTF